MRSDWAVEREDERTSQQAMPRRIPLRVPAQPRSHFPTRMRIIQMMTETPGSCKSGGSAILAIALGEEAHHFVEACNLEVEDRAIVHQPFHHCFGGTEQLQLNVVCGSPALEKQQHTEAATTDRFDFGKIERNDAGLGLRHYDIAKLENGVAVDDPSFTINHTQISQAFDVYGHHGMPPEWI